jgi:hypothetical protein
MSQPLANLKLVNAKRQNTIDPVTFRRNKLLGKLKVQLLMATALSRNETFVAKRLKKVTDGVTGVVTTVEVAKRVKTWWFMNTDTGKYAVHLYYGSKVVELAKGKNAVEAVDMAAVLDTLQRFQEAVSAGGLDSQIAVAADSVKARFK